MHARSIGVSALFLAGAAAWAGPANHDAALAAQLRASSDPAVARVRLPTHDGLPSEFDAARGAATFLWPAPDLPPARLQPLRPAQAAGDAARHYLRAQQDALRITAAQVSDARMFELHDTGRGALIARFRQQHAGLPVLGRELNVMMDRDLRLVATSGSFADAASSPGSGHRLAAERALELAHADLLSPGSVTPSFKAGRRIGDYTHFDPSPSTGTRTRTLRFDAAPRSKPVWYALGNTLRPAYYVELSGQAGDDGEMLAYASVIAADDGEVLARKNLVEDAEYSYRVFADANGIRQPFDSPRGNALVPFEGRFPNIEAPPLRAATQLVTLASGPIVSADPWLAAGAGVTRGNNVDAYLDLAAPDGFTPESTDLRPTLSGSSSFDYPYAVDGDPTPATQRQHAGVNLFYVNNWLHDWWYDNGFDEAAGNAQTDNYGRGGVGNDPVLAEGQDYSGRNNANMRTPADGQSPRMQMFLWDYNFSLPAPGEVTVTAPAAIAGSLPFGTSVIGPQRFDLQADLVAIAAAGSAENNACQPASLSPAAVVGRIALLTASNACTGAQQVINADAAGAVGVIFTSGAATPFNLSMAAPGVDIPVLSVSGPDADRLRGGLATGPVRIRMRRDTSFDVDSTLDNQIVAHEWFHYASNRLIGDSMGLINQQGRAMGEGWSDFNALLLSVREDDRLIPGNDRHQGAHGVSHFSSRNGYFGIRRAPYSTDFDLFPLTFRHIADGEPLPDRAPINPGPAALPNSQVHNAGSIWCNALWEAYVNLLNDPRHSHLEAQTRMKDYLIAGLKMTPVAPTLLEARDALIAAARARDRRDAARIADAFARRGMGLLARGPDRDSTSFFGVRESYLPLPGLLPILR